MEQNGVRGDEIRGEVQRGQKRDYLLPASILIAGVMISGSIVYLVRNPSTGVSPEGNSLAAVGALPAAQVGSVTDRDVILGNPSAPVTVIEYGDYQCPVCGLFFSDSEPLVREKYVNTGEVRMVYRNFAFLGPESIAAAEAAECAKDQKKFWSFHDAIYKKEIKDGSENNGNLNRDLFLTIAKDVGLDEKAFTSCVDGKKYTPVVQKETAEGRSAGVDATPTFYVNGLKIRGLVPFEGSGGLKSIIDTALEANYTP